MKEYRGQEVLAAPDGFYFTTYPKTTSSIVVLKEYNFLYEHGTPVYWFLETLYEQDSRIEDWILYGPLTQESVMEPYVDLVRMHMEKWKEETRHISSISNMTQHPSYQEIIRIGKLLPEYVVVRMLLKDMESAFEFWFFALKELTGENPTTAAMQGHIDELCGAWVTWGYEKGILC